MKTMQDDNSLWREFGVVEPPYLPDELGPPVDEESLRCLVRGVATPQQADQLHRRVDRYRSWEQAYARILIEEADA